MAHVQKIIRLWCRALRVDQWTKNGVVMLAWFFSVADASQRDIARGWESFLLALAMAASFSLISSAFYLLNDVSDYDEDRKHPVKRHRPVAAGLISRIVAIRTGLVLFAAGFAYPAMVVILSPRRTMAFATVLAYTVMQCLYTGFLKRVPYVDVVMLSMGFVLRAAAGAAIITAYISPWLLICTFTLSLFLALCKRKHELDTANESRGVLKKYHRKTTIAGIWLAAAASVAEYLTYTLRSKMGMAFPYLWTTSILVAAGIARYMYLSWQNIDTGRPEKVLLSDKWIWAILVGYAVCSVTVVWVEL